MRSVCLLTLFVAIVSAANPGHPQTLKRSPPTRLKSAPRPPTYRPVPDDNGRNGNGRNGNGWNTMVTNFLQMFQRAPPNVQQQLINMFSQAAAPAAAPQSAAPPQAAVPGAVPPGAAAPPPAAGVPPQVAPGTVVPPSAGAGPAMPPTRLKSAPRPAYTYKGRPALFDPAALNEPAPAGQYPAPQPVGADAPLIDPLQFFQLFTDAPEVKKNGEYVEY